MVLAVATVFDVVGVRALLFTQQAGELSAAEGGGIIKTGVLFQEIHQAK